MYKYLTFLCVALLTWCLIATRSCVAEKAHVSATERNAASLQDSLKEYRTKAGILVAVTRSQEGTIAELKVTNAAMIKDHAAKMDLKDEQIEGAQNVVAKMRIAFVDLVNMTRKGDTVERVDHADSNNVFHAVVTEDTAGRRTIHVVDTPVVDIHLTEYASKWNILKPLAPTNHYIGAYSDNCEAHITGLESVLVVKEKPRVMRTVEAVAVGFAGGLLLHLLLK